MEKETKKHGKISLTVFVIFAIITALIIASLMFCVYLDRTDKEVPASTTQNVIAE